MTLTPATLRLDTQGRPCGRSYIATGKTCRKRGSFPTRKAIAAGLTAGAVGAVLLNKESRRAVIGAPAAAQRAVQRGVTEVVHRATAKPPSMRLTPAAFEQLKPPSKTERLHRAAQQANKEAEQAMGRAAQAEIERGVTVGKAMYAAGKATRASLRSGVRRHNLTVEKLRRRYEPGYRKPRRDNYIQYYAPVRLQPPFRLDGPSTEYYRTHPEAAAKKVRTQAKINRRPEERERRAELNRERRKRGIDGQGGPDMSHTTSGRMVAEAPSTNRARNGHGDQPRLRKDSGVVFVTPRLVDPGRQDACWAGYVQAGMKRKGKKEVPNCVPASSGLKKPRAQRDAEGDGKKYTKVVTNPETGRKKRVRYGAKGYRIAPGTDKGDRYCARSFGDMKSHGKDCSGADRNSPLCLSRAKWKCSGESSRRGDALTPGKS